ncbi:hypothetical protein A5657_14740 [Mycobacterium kubicae]|nr:hypothetical protein A5657_14740 [Mycobacterium kubicae]
MCALESTADAWTVVQIRFHHFSTGGGQLASGRGLRITSERAHAELPVGIVEDRLYQAATL